MENAGQSTHPREFEDALMYLPRKAPTGFRKRQIVFDEHHPQGAVHFILRGRVKVILPLHDGSETVVDIFGAGDLLGESSFLGNLRLSQRAVALDNVSLMSWTTLEIEEQCERQPKLGIAFIRLFAQRGLDYQARLQSFALDKTPERLVRSLLRLADRMGTRTGDDGCIGIPPLTHQVIADYVGTTREMINLQMNQLRHNGSLRYSRKGIQIYAQALRDYLRPQGLGLPGAVPVPSAIAE
jgi:CRP/FNR family transcriptional regulator